MENKSCRGKMVTVQNGDTCWFHAAANGWILSVLGSMVLRSVYKTYQKVYPTFQPRYTNSCPVEGSLPVETLMSYLYFAMNKKGPRPIDKWAVRAFAGSNQVNTGPERDVSEFAKFLLSERRYKRMKATGDGRFRLLGAPKSFTTNHTTSLAAVSYRNEQGSNIIPVDLSTDKRFGDLFVLSHAYIFLRTPRGSHAITGYVCEDSNLYIYDSNRKQSYPCQWNDKELFEMQLKRLYKDTTLVYEKTQTFYVNLNFQITREDVRNMGGRLTNHSQRRKTYIQERNQRIMADLSNAILQNLTNEPNEPNPIGNRKNGKNVNLLANMILENLTNRNNEPTQRNQQNKPNKPNRSQPKGNGKNVNLLANMILENLTNRNNESNRPKRPRNHANLGENRNRVKRRRV